jgi:hypothetical protein
MKNWVNDLVDASPVARHVAYAGELEFAGCTEDDRTGRTVTFLLRRPLEDMTKAHPFSAHTRRRRGHAGTLFEVSLQLISGAGPTGMHSMMLLNWGAGPKGETAKFLLNFEEAKHPFLQCQRAAREQEATRWMAAFIETDDQSQAVDQKQRAAVERSTSIIAGTEAFVHGKEPMRKPKQQIKNSNLAAQFIKNERFWKYLKEMHGHEVTSTNDADRALKWITDVSSKAEFDSHPKDNWFDDLRGEFVQWQLDTYGPEALTV